LNAAVDLVVVAALIRLFRDGFDRYAVIGALVRQKVLYRDAARRVIFRPQFADIDETKRLAVDTEQRVTAIEDHLRTITAIPTVLAGIEATMKANAEAMRSLVTGMADFRKEVRKDISDTREELAELRGEVKIIRERGD
jgi:hypothetical protein